MAHESEYQAGSMDMTEHRKTYERFLSIGKWSTIVAILSVIFLAIFRTN